MIVGKYLWICFVLVWIGCARPDNDVRRIVVDVKDIQKSFPVSRIFDSLRYIPLETTKESLFKQIDKLCMDSEGNFYVLDREGVNAIYKFDQQGRFRGQIGYQGKGPREYLRIYDFCLYQDTIVEIYDAEREKRMQYNTSGQFLWEEDGWAMGGAAFIHLGDTVAFYTSCGGYGPNLNLSVNGKKYGFFKQDYPELWSKWEYFHTDGSRIYCSDNYNDTIYYFRDSRMEPYFYVDFLEHKLPKEIRENYKANSGNFCYNIGKVRFTFDCIYFSFDYRGFIINAFLDKKQNTLNLTESYDNDIDGVPFHMMTEMPSCPDKMVTCLDANTAIRAYKGRQKRGGKISGKYEALMEQLTEESNPVIVFAYLKK